MMHKTARQRADGTGWHYVLGSRNGGHPIGYCAKHDPHPTEAEARECYGRYVREQTIRLNASSVGWTSCQAWPEGQRCTAPTKSYAAFGDDGYGMVTLCSEHMTVEHVIASAGLAGPAGDAWIS